MTAYKIDLGCGPNKKEGFLGVDFTPGEGVDFVANFQKDPLPFPDRSCAYIYSSHCLEHISNPYHLFSEISRVSSEGARIEIWVPYAHHNDALLIGHVHYYTEEYWNHISVQHPDHWCNIFGGYWLWKRVTYVIPATIQNELLRHQFDINFAVRHLNNIVKEICFEFEFSSLRPQAFSLPARNYAPVRNGECSSLPLFVDPAHMPDPDSRDFTSLTVNTSR